MSDCDLGSPLPFFPSFIRSNKQRGVWGHPSRPAPPDLQGVPMHLCVYDGSLWPESKLSQEPHILGLGHCPQGRQAIKMNTEQISNLLFKFVWKNILFPLPRQPQAGPGWRAALGTTAREMLCQPQEAELMAGQVKNHSFPEPALSHELPRWPGWLFLITTWNEKIPDWYQWRMIQNSPWLMSSSHRAFSSPYMFKKCFRKHKN